MRVLASTALVLGLGVSVAGCVYDWRTEVRRTAGFEHSCSVSDVVILGDDGNPMARSVQLDVCGSRRLYRDVGGTRMYLWIDATDTVDGPGGGRGDRTVIAESERTTSPEISPEAAMEILRQLEEPVLECTHGEAVAIHATVDRTGHLTNVTGLTQVPSDVQRCVAAAIAGVTIDTGGVAQRLALRISSRPMGAPRTSGGATPPPPPVDMPPDRAMRARLDAAATRVLACVGTDTVVVELTWSAGATTATLSLRGVTDPAATECALAAIGDLSLGAPADGDGRLMHALSR